MLGLALLLLALVSPLPLPAYAQISVGRLKSLFVERFTRFVEWPADTLPPGATFVVCIEGTGETADNLFDLATAKKFKDRLCEVRRVRPGSELGSCHLLYLAATEGPRLPAVLANVAGKPVLTIADTPGFGDKGVQINLYPQDKLMNFEINLPAVKRSRLTFSSQLLRLGRLVGSAEAVPR
jgi:hypothetical protein